MENDEASFEELRQKWLRLGRERPPEWLAAFVESPRATWMVVTANGPEVDRQRYMACLERERELPFWAFVLARAYLDDVGEWPLFGMHAEYALDEFEKHGEAERAVREIIAAIHPVWPDVELIHVGRQQG